MTTTAVAPTELGGNYPESFAEFVGQDAAKRQLDIAAGSAKIRDVPGPHVLLAKGSPGIGKTTLGVLYAKQLGRRIKFASGKITATEARVLLSDMVDGDVLLIDEIHLLAQGNRQNASWLLNYLQDGVLLGPLGPEEAPRVTVVGCTTDAAKLPQPVLDRFLKPKLDDYTDSEAVQIAGSMARRILLAPLPQPSEDNLAEIAQAASNNPRTMGQVLSNLRDIALVSCGDNWDGQRYEMSEALDFLGLTADGLTNTAQAYLIAMLVSFRGEAVGKDKIADRLQESAGLQFVEQQLMNKGLLGMTKGGRLLTPAGIRRARELTGG